MIISNTDIKRYTKVFQAILRGQFSLFCYKVAHHSCMGNFKLALWTIIIIPKNASHFKMPTLFNPLFSWQSISLHVVQASNHRDPDQCHKGKPKREPPETELDSYNYSQSSNCCWNHNKYHKLTSSQKGN